MKKIKLKSLVLCFLLIVLLKPQSGRVIYGKTIYYKELLAAKETFGLKKQWEIYYMDPSLSDRKVNPKKVGYRPKDNMSFDYVLYGLDVAGVVSVLMLACYYLGIYFTRLKEKHFLISSFLLGSIGLNILFSGEKIIFKIYTHLSPILAYKIQGVLSVINGLLLILFIKVQKSPVLALKIYRYIIISLIMGCLIIFIIPYQHYTAYLIGLLGYTLILIFYILIRLIFTNFNSNSAKLIQWKKTILIIVVASYLIVLMGKIGYLLCRIKMDYFVLIATSLYVLSIAVLEERRLHQVYSDMKKISSHLIKVDRLRDEFLVKTSHELRSPLKGINSIVYFILEKQNNLTLTQKEHLQLVRTIAERLHYLVTDIQDLTHLKNGKLQVNITSVDIKSNIELIRMVYEFEIQKKGIKFHVDLKPYWVYGDENRIRQVLYNLIENALNHTYQGIIQISGFRHEEYITIHVEDTGIGMSLETKNMVQKMLQNMEYDSQEAEYIQGLGLKISANLLKVMKGKLELKYSEKDKGTKFSFTLPYAGSGMQEEYSVKKDVNVEDEVKNTNSEFDITELKTKASIIIMVENNHNRYILENALYAQGYRILQAYIESDVTRLIESPGKTDMIILDIMPPTANGLQICKKIRESYSSVELPILMTIPESSSRMVNLIFEAGANDFVRKPYEIDVVITRVKNLISIKHAFQEAVRNELAFLQAQIKPHFLYNAMSTIVSLCYSDSIKAANLLLDLSKYLRLSFDIDWSDMFIPLCRELELIDAYIRVEKARFGSRIYFHYEGEDALKMYKIPALMIQPLVENAIRHGICKKEEGGKVILTIKKSLQYMYIKVEDDGVGISKEKLEQISNNELINQGIGLLNIRKRLALYKNAQMEFSSKENVGTTVFIRLPLNPGE
ncbi:hybrid sensor histidine kinase/response regulator [Cellulosilyticum sp. I15G10I2]|uniref:hybrid sensor histidine kinase/response regulator n=1 Tax=Cellulosilyticum sp. I15G10I2 TaxID=1892843 RepID=UPI00085BB58F|nr:ATP-binding protein [Cellulosilyticum sp. I15G10I2]